jgi:hypothetical protein
VYKLAGPHKEATVLYLHIQFLRDGVPCDDPMCKIHMCLAKGIFKLCPIGDGHLELLHLEGKTLKQLELREQVQRPWFLPCLGQFNQQINN